MSSTKPEPRCKALIDSAAATPPLQLQTLPNKDVTPYMGVPAASHLHAVHAMGHGAKTRNRNRQLHVV